jgi:hypothetical protein
MKKPRPTFVYRRYHKIHDTPARDEKVIHATDGYGAHPDNLIRPCEGCGAPLDARDSTYTVCYGCTIARAHAVQTKRCVCRSKQRLSGTHQTGSRKWISCLRCLGTVRQLR